MPACRGRLLQLAEISPQLAALADSGVPMPAITPASTPVAPVASWHADGGGHVSIAGLEGRLEILGTKTRPKRLWLRGSDGTRVSFLVKVRGVPLGVNADARSVWTSMATCCSKDREGARW
jgi:PI-3-kinase-related kinase SMG-1